MSDCVALRDEFIILVSRVLVKHFTAFAFLKDVVVDHIPHQYSTEMKKKFWNSKSSFAELHINFICCLKKVPLGILTKCENKTEDMVDIIEFAQQQSKMESCRRYSLGVTSSRENMLVITAQEAKAQSSTALGRLQCVIPKVEDWHTLVTFYQVCHSNFTYPSFELFQWKLYVYCRLYGFSYTKTAHS